VKKLVEKLSHTNYNIIFGNDVVEEMPVEVLEIGNVSLPTGLHKRFGS
jgi:hypothetical protein